MFCSKCGKEIPDDSVFCPSCGAKVTPIAPEAAETPAPAAPEAEKPAPAAPEAEKPKKTRSKVINSQKDIEGQQITDNIYLCRDGVYRWVYEMPMLKNFTILYTVWKVMGIAIGILFVIMQIFHLFGDGFSSDGFLFDIKLMGIMAAIFLVLGIISYFILAAIYGWKYVALFEMDEKEICHTQVPKQQKKAEIIGLITALAGLASKNMTTAGIGITHGSRNKTTTEFRRVKSIKAVPRRHVIKLSQGLSHNQVYADGADFDFALDFIQSRCPNAKR